ncbi:MAG: family 20 glycosylhydrolase, partial [Planctomycetota bacterium]
PAVEAVTITDYPRYRLRGFQFDAGRCPQSIAMMKRMIRICSSFKLNFVMFREGDDELNAVRYKSNKLGSLNPRAISTEKMAELIQYAQRYHIKIIPEIESLGHSAAKGFHYPQLLHPGGRRQKYEGIGIHLRKRRLVLENPQTYQLLKSIYSEWIPMLTSPYIHLGCDEAGRGTGEHLAKLTAMLNELGRENYRTIRPIVWADAAPTPEALKGQVIRCLWAYGETGGREIDVNNKFLNHNRQGVKELSKPSCKEEVLMAGGSDSYHTPLAKAGYENALPNIYSWCQFGKDKLNFIGIFAVQWSGNQHDLWLPDDLTVAEYGWTPDKPTFNFGQCMKRIKESLSKLKDYTNPRPEEVDQSCWDGIWLTEDNKWGEDIMGRAIPISEK